MADEDRELEREGSDVFSTGSRPYVELSAVIRRADGTVEDLGVIASNVIYSKTWAQRVKKAVRRVLEGRSK